MPVIQIPRDDRWGQLGAGLGGLLGGVVQAVQQRQATQGVAQIWSDPAVPDDQKLIRSMQQYGDMGAQVGLQFLKAKTMQEQLKEINAKIGLEGSQGRAADALAAIRTAQAPLAAPLEQAKIDVEKGKIPLQQAQTAVQLGRLPLQQAQTGEAAAKAQEAQAGTAFTTGPRTQAERQLGGERAASTELKQTETDLKRVELAATEKMKADIANLVAPAPGAAHPMDPVLDTLPGLTPENKAAARQIYNGIITSATSPKELVGAREKAFLTAEGYARKASEASATPIQIAKEASDAARSATSASRFLDSFERQPSIGLLSGATIKAWWEGKGGSSGDAELLNQYDAGLLQASDTARSGGGFWSVGRFHLAQDTTATIRDSPLRAVINMDQTAERRIAELQSYKASQPGRQLKDVDDALTAWQRVKERTSSYQTYTTNGKETVVLHDGSQLAATNFKVLVDANKAYKDRDGAVWKGSEITAAAQSGSAKDPTPRTPQEVMRLLGIATRQ